MLIFCLIVGWLVLLPQEYQQLGKHTAAGSIFLSNIILWSESGYFNNSSDTKPLLHLWSLGIEEQFYILWPFLLWFSWKKRLSTLTFLVVLIFISFNLNIYFVINDPITTFYLPHTRFW